MVPSLSVERGLRERIRQTAFFAGTAVPRRVERRPASGCSGCGSRRTVVPGWGGGGRSSGARSRSAFRGSWATQWRSHWGDPHAPRSLILLGSACGVVSAALVVWYVVSLFVDTGRTPYDRATASRVGRAGRRWVDLHRVGYDATLDVLRRLTWSASTCP